MAVFMACLNPGDKFLGLNLAHGGHLSHGSPVNFSGLMYKALEYNVRESDGLVDYAPDGGKWPVANVRN